MNNPFPDINFINSIKLKLKLAFIVETQNLDLIVHPVITRLVKVKWRQIAMWRAYLDLVLSFINIAVWNLLGVLIPYNERYIYTFPQDWWRIFLFIIGILGMILLIVIEAREVLEHSKYYEVSEVGFIHIDG